MGEEDARRHEPPLANVTVERQLAQIDVQIHVSLGIKSSVASKALVFSLPKALFFMILEIGKPYT